MKILIIGDIHGNLVSLEKLLKIEENNYDLLVCHGDIVNYGPWSNECVELLRLKQNSIILKGNHEEDFIKRKYSGTHPIVIAFFNFCMPNFLYFDYISTLGLEYKFDNFTVQHTIQEKYIFKDTFITDLHIQNNYIIGHSHQQYERFVGDYKIINTGSLGQNREHINIANYIIYDSESKFIEYKNFTFDIDKVINKMESMGYDPICLNYYKHKKRI